MTKKLNQKGFSVVEGLLVIIALAIVIFVGYYVYHSQKQTDKTYSEASKVAQSAPQKSTSSSTKFLVIKEWNVQLKLNATNQDAYYAADPQNVNSVYISSKALDTFGAQHSECSGVNRSLTLTRLKPGDESPFGAGGPATEADLAGQGTKVGDYYYVMTTGQPCFGDDTDTVNQLMSQVGELRAKLPTDKDVVAVN